MAELQKPLVPHRLFRFRSLTRDTNVLDQEIEAIRDNYLYCPEFTRMNDPMEGFFRPSEVLKGHEDYKAIVRQITNVKSGIGIACFTETHENMLMWTHYAGNSTGMCLAYSSEALLNGLPRHVNLVRLAYLDNPPVIYPDEVRNAEDAAIRILSQKKFNWAYEREWRVLGPLGRIDLGRVSAVRAIYFGSRVNLRHRQKILSRLQGKNIAAYMMEVDGYDHSFEPINALAKRLSEARA